MNSGAKSDHPAKQRRSSGISGSLAARPESLISANRDELTMHGRLIQSIFLIASAIIFLLALIYVVIAIRGNWSAFSLHDFAAVDYRWIALSAIAYGASVLITVSVWPIIVKSSNILLPFHLGHCIGLVAQTGKYLPGNIAQHFGRAALATHHGVSLTQSGLSTIVELAAAIIGGIIFVAVCLVVDPGLFEVLENHIDLSSVSLWMVPVFIVLLAVGYMLARMSGHPLFHALNSWRLWAPSVLLYAMSFALAGLSFYAIIRALAPTAALEYDTLSVVFAVAWLVGFLLPGAPAGLGVREAILIAFLTGNLGPSVAIVCAIGHRLLSAVADGFMALAGALVLYLHRGPHAD